MRLEEGHIGPREGVFLVYAVLVGSLFLQDPAYLIEVGGPAAWQTALVMTAVALLLFLPIIALAQRFPGQGLAEISEAVAGPFLGPVLTLAASLWLLGTTTLGVRNFAETFITAILPNTPPSALIVPGMICLIYASYQGLEPMSRSAQVLMPLIAGGVLIVLLANFPQADTARLYPFWGHGALQTLTGGAYYSTLAAEVTGLLAVGYGFRTGQELRTAGVAGILLFGLTAMATVAMLVMVFGSADAAQQPFPLFVLARLIYAGRFLQRVEALLVMFWILAAGVRLAALFHSSVVSLTGALRLPYYRPVTLPVGVLVTALSLLPEDYLQVLRLDRDWLRPLGFGAMAIPLVLLLLSSVRRKGGQDHAA